jgi:hypothetical protein
MLTHEVAQDMIRVRDDLYHLETQVLNTLFSNF